MKNKRSILVWTLVIITGVLTVAYASLNTLLDITGVASINGNGWNIYLADVRDKTTISNTSLEVDDIPEKSMSLRFSVVLKHPMESKASFTVKVVNAGSIDAELSNITLTGVDNAKNNHVTYSVTYSDGSNIQVGDKLPGGTNRTLKISVSYDEISNEELPTENISLDLGLSLNYIQSTDGSSSSDTNISTNNKVLAGLYGNSIQNGTPTPDSPVEIESVGEKTKNLFDTSLFKKETVKGVTFEYLEDEDCFLINGTATSNTSFATTSINFKIKTISTTTTYTISTKYVSGTIDRSIASDGKYAVAYFGKSDDGSTRANWSAPSLENYDTSQSSIPGTNYINRFWFYLSPGVSFDNYKVKIQLEEGSTATSYEPYGYKIPITVNGTTENIYLDEPLRKVGEYADYLDLQTGKVVRNVGEVEFTGSETWSKYASASNHYQTNVNNNLYSNSTNFIISNYYNSANPGGYSSSQDYAIISVDGSRVRFKNKDIDTLEEWKNYVLSKYNSGVPIKVDYVLRTPTEEIVTIPSSLTNLTENYTIGTSIQPTLGYKY